MMIGVTSAEAYILLNSEEMELGLETDSRNKLVSDLVTATYHHHQKEIFSAVITEYTDWASVSRHPVTTRPLIHIQTSSTTITNIIPTFLPSHQPKTVTNNFYLGYFSVK